MADINWAEWGPPLAVLGAGVVAGVVLVLRSGARFEADPRKADLLARKDVLMKRLGELEADREKLDEQSFNEQKTRLVTEAAEVLRALEEESPVAPAATASTSSGPSSRLAVWAVGLVLFFGVAGYLLNQGLQPRREGASMTGNQDLGGPSEAPSTAGCSAQDPRMASALATLNTDPNDLDALNLATRVSLECQELQEGMAFLDRSRAIDEDHPEVQTHLAALEMIIGRYETAEGRLRAALLLHPDLSEAKIWLALNLGNQGKLDEAQDLLTSIVTDPKADAQDKGAAGQLLTSLSEAMNRPPPTSSSLSEPTPSEQASPPAGGAPVLTGAVSAGADIAPGGVLFVYARRGEATRGPPLAAKRFPDWSLPLDFTLSDSDLIMGGDWPDEIWLSAKISRSGDPMKRSDDDVQSVVVGPLKPGTEGVKIQLGE